MIQSALGESPLAENLRSLADSDGARVTGSPQAEKAILWAVEALRRAGVDEVHTEKFAVQTGSTKGNSVESENVVGEIRGREKPEEFVLLGTRLDSSDPWPSTGIPRVISGHENDGNIAMVIDAARVIHRSGTIPRRSIRFVLFTGECEGLSGSRAYAISHRAELDHMIAAIIFTGDPVLATGSTPGPVTGYSLGGRKDILMQVREALDPVKSLGVSQFTLNAVAGAENFDFLLEGVPTLVANEVSAKAAPKDRADQDTRHTLDVIDGEIKEIKRHVAIAAVTTYALADAAERIGPRQSRPEIERLLKDTGLAENMLLEGYWTDWYSGKRGRQP